MSRRIPVDLFFDVISPYSWIGFEGLLRYKRVWPLDVRLRPFYLAGVIKATKNKAAPLNLDQKFAYMDLDLKRNSAYWGIPLSLPKNFKDIALTKSSARAQRILIVLQKQQPSLVEEAARLMWRRLFTDHLDLFDNKNLLKIMYDLNVQYPAALLEASSSEEIKAALKANTDEALAMGCFGAPWIHVQTTDGKVEPFFGSDRFPLIGHLIGEKFQGPLTNLEETPSR
ncbi:DsbA-like protein [Oesophagostomum dentatum]|uniref:Glutathione S-transferase kappa n=1 Tax=Oesophagostomum dentatum TaxID=61180 RepID=A0A0B1RQ73_OESDE|nr:DsbA-like protein [Oesophagostomum dentatum]